MKYLVYITIAILTIGCEAQWSAFKKNPENPRMIFYEEDLSILKASIKNNGILVPLTVYKKPTEKKYTILDGERRWKCALDLRLKTVPANEIHPPSKKQNILLMFNIHKVHKDWELVPTALKLEMFASGLPKLNLLPSLSQGYRKPIEVVSKL